MKDKTKYSGFKIVPRSIRNIDLAFDELGFYRCLIDLATPTNRSVRWEYPGKSPWTYHLKAGELLFSISRNSKMMCIHRSTIKKLIISLVEKELIKEISVGDSRPFTSAESIYSIVKYGEMSNPEFDFGAEFPKLKRDWTDYDTGEVTSSGSPIC